MKTSGQSAFLTRMTHLAELSLSDRAALAALEQNPTQLAKRQTVFAPGSPDDRIAIIRSGLAITRIMSGSQTTIAQLFMAGEVVGLSELGFSSALYQTTMQTDGTVSLISRKRLGDLARTNPRIFAMLLSMASLDSVTLLDRLHAVTRYSAEDRLMHFLLTVQAKTDQVSEQGSDRFPMPLSQKEIGDVLGLTDIYVNRLLRNLQKRGALEIARPYFRIIDKAAWVAQLDYKDRFSAVDFSWAG
ncbi:cAMP-binding domain of CRP or a regulatory subunit of cAMP-dependent protein kinases [Loktanella sp. DSM 29012]|uniref:Crp/Fnr family transcriptional regulator n=1 Tax=Loktanella gaetbuli TaxID=2881335 RepID=A0ABS8BW41_9RHOB|nr:MULTISPECIES: Crp/Fnr family transcriptional regulator [Loktanella]MCB5199958.1 Crp/Fnr family transcriptional regulator [Loktanella gaetbuli]SEQ42696.1 cAMP-binding domain of CRP or a regulatory subunit of cAMP-dependent protein kinases [Loktanella sp. DSM 29012]